MSPAFELGKRGSSRRVEGCLLLLPAGRWKQRAGPRDAQALEGKGVAAGGGGVASVVCWVRVRKPGGAADRTPARAGAGPRPGDWVPEKAQRVETGKSRSGGRNRAFDDIAQRKEVTQRSL